MSFSPYSDNYSEIFQRRAHSYFDVVPGVAAFFSKSLLEQRGWTALIYECDFKDDAIRVARACGKFSYSKAVCLNVDQNQNEMYSIDLSVQDLSAVHKIYHVPSYAVIEDKESFAIVSDSDYYWAIAGKKDFLEDVAEQGIGVELDSFAAGISPYVVSSDPHNHAIGQYLLSFLALCRERLVVSGV